MKLPGSEGMKKGRGKSSVRRWFQVKSRLGLRQGDFGDKLYHKLVPA
jgi:hypothetical protein